MKRYRGYRIYWPHGKGNEWHGIAMRRGMKSLVAANEGNLYKMIDEEHRRVFPKGKLHDGT